MRSVSWRGSRGGVVVLLAVQAAIPDDGDHHEGDEQRGGHEEPDRAEVVPEMCLEVEAGAGSGGHVPM